MIPVMVSGASIIVLRTAILLADRVPACRPGTHELPGWDRAMPRANRHPSARLRRGKPDGQERSVLPLSMYF